MSRIYFHSIDSEVEVRGSERAYFGNMISGITWSFLGTYAFGSDPELKKIFPKNHYIHSAQNFRESARIALSAGVDEIRVGETSTDSFAMELNTVYTIGNDCLKLATRIHGQCELHAYVLGENREWLAGIIEKGLESKIYHTNAGWEKVIDLLKKTDTSPIVTSYSVCDSFPNAHIAGICDEAERESWYDLPYEKQWEDAVRALVDSGGGLEITPENWTSFYFNNGVTALSIIEQL